MFKGPPPPFLPRFELCRFGSIRFDSTYVRVQAHILNGLYHVQACFHAAHRVIRSRLPVVALELRHTVVTIAQQLHAQGVPN